MNYISEEILEVSKKHGIQSSMLSQEESEAVRAKVARRFGLQKSDLLACGPNTSEYKVVCNDNAWRWIGDFVRGSLTFLLVGEGTQSETWRIEPGECLVELLGDMFGFAFFLTNEGADYLLCYDDHNCLIGFGTAAAWLGGLQIGSDEGEANY